MELIKLTQAELDEKLKNTAYGSKTPKAAKDCAERMIYALRIYALRI